MRVSSGLEKRYYPGNAAPRDWQKWLDFCRPRDLLATSPSDVLFLLDCCHAAGAAIGATEKELIAACAIESIARTPGYNSFTTALVQELQHATTSGEYLSTAMLFAKLLQKSFNGSLVHSPLHVEMSPKARASIMLLPRPPLLLSLPSPVTWPNNIPVSVVLSVQLRDGTSKTLYEIKTWLTKSKPPRVSRVFLKSAWPSCPCILVFELPVEAWYCFDSHPAIALLQPLGYRHLGAVRLNEIPSSFNVILCTFAIFTYRSSACRDLAVFFWPNG